MKTDAQGFTLIEMMVALIVLSIGLLGLAGLQASTAKYRINTAVRSASTGLVFDMSERIRVNADAAGPSFLQGGSTAASLYTLSDTWSAQQSADLSSVTNCETNPCNSTQRAAYDMSIWRQKVRAAMPQGGALLSGNKRDGFILTLMWFDKEFNDGTSDRTLLSSTTCGNNLQGMAAQACCPPEAEAPVGVRCSRFSFIP